MAVWMVHGFGVLYDNVIIMLHTPNWLMGECNWSGYTVFEVEEFCSDSIFLLSQNSEPWFVTLFS